MALEEVRKDRTTTRPCTRGPPGRRRSRLFSYLYTATKQLHVRGSIKGTEIEKQRDDGLSSAAPTPSSELPESRLSRASSGWCNACPWGAVRVERDWSDRPLWDKHPEVGKEIGRQPLG